MPKCVCTCGHDVSKDLNEDTQRLNSGTFLSRTELDASFVHLPPPPPANRNMNGEFLMQNYDDSSLFSQGILDSYRYLDTILKVAKEQIDDNQGHGNAADSDICLCSDCIER
jgi:hypothetical protein